MHRSAFGSLERGEGSSHGDVGRHGATVASAGEAPGRADGHVVNSGGDRQDGCHEQRRRRVRPARPAAAGVSATRLSPPGYPGYPPPGYQGYPPPGYQAYPPPGYPGYPPHGYPPGYVAAPPALKPGVIPLRPLSLTDILNGAVAYIRANPKATLGLTTVVVVIAQIIGLILQVGPLAAAGELGVLKGEEASTAAALGSSASGLASGITTLLSSIVLSGMLTVIVGRAVFGATITIGEAWQRVRGRLLALIGYTLLWAFGVIAIIAVVVFSRLRRVDGQRCRSGRSSGFRSASD